jgi:hypothetical protein
MSEQAELDGHAGARGWQAGRMGGPVISVRGIDLEIEAGAIFALALRTFCSARRSRS